MKTWSIILGGVTWLSLCAGAVFALRSQFTENPGEIFNVITGIGRWSLGATGEHLAKSAEPLVLAPGDPIFMKSVTGDYRQVGRVRNHFGPQVIPIKEFATQEAAVVLYDSTVAAAFPDGFSLEYHTAPTSLDWVAKTMITPDRQKEIAQLIARDWKLHREEILVRLQPVIETSIAKAVSAIESELPTVMNSHRGDFAKLADRYQAEVVRNQIVPLVREEILPIVQEEIRPVATELGKELWDRVSLWSFTWRYFYDVSPLPEKNAVKREFDRFIKDEVTPALDARSEEFVQVTERIMRRVSRNEKVRTVVRENLRKAATDGELQTIVWAVVQESVIQNQTLRSSLREYWSSSEVQDAMEVATSRFEPTARAIGDAVFGNREEGVTAEFSRVMRLQILMKDRRWLIVVPKVPTSGLGPVAPPPDLVMIRAKQPMDFPIEFEGKAQSPLTEIKPSAPAKQAAPVP